MKDDDARKKSEQKEFLIRCKKVLARTHPRLTWDQFGALAGIDPRAFKTYRMPLESADFRVMPNVARLAIERLAGSSVGASDGEQQPIQQGPAIGRSPVYALLPAALAALVVRQGKQTLINGRMISGVSKRPGSPVGLTDEDRRAMALVSRACLANGLPDAGGEIHDLLAWCTRPLADWLAIPEVKDAGLSPTVLIDSDEFVPTPEAEELAKAFSSLTAGLEEQLFTKFLEVLGKQPAAAADSYYTIAREFVVRNPIAGGDALRRLGEHVPTAVRACVEQQFYEPISSNLLLDQVIVFCAHCRNAMMRASAGLVCRTACCRASLPAKEGGRLSPDGQFRLTRGLRRFWLEPGFDEIKMFDALNKRGLAARLYPFRDRVDIEVGPVGIDLKAYSSPELLGAKLRRGLGGLSHYEMKWLVVPDWLVARVPAYLDRLRSSLGEHASVRCLSVGQALGELTHA